MKGAVCALAAVLWFVVSPALATPTEPTTAVLEYPGPWEYRFGDSPRNAAGEFLWAASTSDHTGFVPTSRVAGLAGRHGERFLWLRTELSGPPLRNAALYFRGVDQFCEAYLDGRLIFRFGDFSDKGIGRFAGYQAIYLPLGEHYLGKRLALRIYSENVVIGIAGRPSIGSEGMLVAAAMQRDMGRFWVGFLVLVIGLASLILFAMRREELVYLNYGGFTITLGIYVISQAPSRMFLFQAPVGWMYVNLLSLYLLPIFLIGYCKSVFGKGPLGLLPYLRQFHMCCFLLILALICVAKVPIWKTLRPYQYLLLFEGVYFISSSVVAAARGNTEARIASAALLVATVLAAHDVLASMGVLPRTEQPLSHYGSGAFALALGLISARRVVLLHARLRNYSTVLQLSLASGQVLDFAQQTRIALDELVRLLGARRALLFLCRPDKSTLELGAGRDDIGRDIADGIDFDAALVEQVRARRRPLTSSSAHSGLVELSFSRPVHDGAMAVPLVMRSQLLGVLYLERDAEPTSGAIHDDNDNLEILLGLGNQIAIALMTSRALRLELESALKSRRLEQQEELLQAAARLAAGDLAAPIAVPEHSELAHLASALESMRKDLQLKIGMLESHASEVQRLNDELRRQIEQRSQRLLETLLHHTRNRQKGATRLSPGQALGELYRVKRTIGQGAMGTVYEVERIPDGRRLAAKVLAMSTHESSALRFVREAQILARLDHPNLIAIVDIDVTDAGILYIVMELVDGETLKQRREQFGDIPWALDILRQIAAALAVVHERGIVHRDLKPANVLIARSDKGPLVKLADFGISILLPNLDHTTDRYNPQLRPDLGGEDPTERTETLAVPSTGDAPTDKLALGRRSVSTLELTHTGILIGTVQGIFHDRR